KGLARMSACIGATSSTRNSSGMYMATQEACFPTGIPTRCPLYPRKRTCAVQDTMSALGQKRTHAVQQTAPSFEHFVTEREQRRWRSQRGRDGAYFQISSALSTYTLDTLTASAIPRKLWRDLLARSSPVPSCATGP